MPIYGCIVSPFLTNHDLINGGSLRLCWTSHRLQRRCSELFCTNYGLQSLQGDYWLRYAVLPGHHSTNDFISSFPLDYFRVTVSSSRQSLAIILFLSSTLLCSSQYRLLWFFSSPVLLCNSVLLWYRVSHSHSAWIASEKKFLVFDWGGWSIS